MPRNFSGAFASRRRPGFLLALVLTVVAARALAALGMGDVAASPEAGALRTLFVVLIFAIGGLTLRTAELGRAAAHVRLHVFTQGMSLALIPLLFLLFDALLARTALEPDLRHGLLILACMPTTVTSCVVYTRLAGGNEAGALFNATLGNLLGILITPQLLLLLLGRTAVVDAGGIVGKLLLTVLLPVLVGQVLRVRFADRIDLHAASLKQASNALLLAILFLVFLDTFSRPLDVSGASIALILAIVVAARVALLAIAWALSALPGLGFSRADRIAATITGTQKTVVLGLPMISLLFAGHPRAGLLAVPLLVYHLAQLVIDGLLAPLWARGGDDGPAPAVREKGAGTRRRGSRPLARSVTVA